MPLLRERERERERESLLSRKMWCIHFNGEREAHILASREHSRLGNKQRHILAERAVMSLLIMNLHSHD